MKGLARTLSTPHSLVPKLRLGTQGREAPLRVWPTGEAPSPRGAGKRSFPPCVPKQELGNEEWGRNPLAARARAAVYWRALAPTSPPPEEGQLMATVRDILATKGAHVQSIGPEATALDAAL